MINGKCKDFRRPFAMSILIASALALAACAGKSTLGLGDPLTTASTGPVSLKETAALGERWRKNPSDVPLGLAYAERLKSLDQDAQQLDVLKTLADRNPAD